jgi:hypothetical protein
MREQPDELRLPGSFDAARLPGYVAVGVLARSHYTPSVLMASAIYPQYLVGCNSMRTACRVLR